MQEGHANTAACLGPPKRVCANINKLSFNTWLPAITERFSAVMIRPNTYIILFVGFLASAAFVPSSVYLQKVRPSL